MGLDQDNRTLDETATQLRPLFDVGAARRVVPLRDLGPTKPFSSWRRHRRRLPLTLALGLVLGGALIGSLFALSWVKRQQVAAGVAVTPAPTATPTPTAPPTPNTAALPPPSTLSPVRSSVATAASSVATASNGAGPAKSSAPDEGRRKEERKEARKIERERRAEGSAVGRETNFDEQETSETRKRRVRGKKAQEEVEDQLRRIREIFEGTPR